MAENVSPPLPAKFDQLICPLRDEYDKLHKLLAARDEEIDRLRGERDLYKNAYESVNARNAARVTARSASDYATEDKEIPTPRSSPGRSVAPRLRLDSSRPLWKNEPRPCNDFYLLDDCHHPNCIYSHDYDITPREKEIIREGLKKAVPCAEVMRGDPCSWGEKCLYGHACPNGPTCWYNKNGRCHYKGADMHKEEDAGSQKLNIRPTSRSWRSLSGSFS
ncbi:hypothetical protein BD626DRAFT_481144 [Schizophyllum amplum]|uniref:C3H1-type domain-containing protein n=1 Tax=Schizophyllum amplum TaxID=97359 RepID=A0A550CTX4_9AGAR|nr:hypothetical protein BD626DRAFT_481144 [Auriculariopsis ampla]